MANHKSALKRIRSSEAKRVRNKYYFKTTRNAIRNLRSLSDKIKAQEVYPGIVSMIDNLAKRNIIHKSKASNLKSKLAVQIGKL